VSDEGELITFATRDDEKKVAFEVSGASDGFPVFLMHGMPGCRAGPKPRSISLYRHGIRLICYDRPGYGRSDRREGRDVADTAQDVAAVATELGLDRFAIVGRSGGGPHALACAADPVLREMVTRVAVLVSFAPSDIPGFNWFAGMNDDNVRGFSRDAPDTAARTREIEELAKRTLEHPRHLMPHLKGQMTLKDRQVVNQFGLRRKIVDAHREALRNGPGGWIDDALALCRNWKFELDAIDTAMTEVLIWHGEEDTFAPVDHAYWLQKQIQGAKVHVEPDAAHFDAMEALPRLLPWLAGGAEPARHRAPNRGALIGVH
jgi:pimeloyl-ACP methyl ester carboxylesterase